jgi:protein O-mannosyl-transferase
LTGRSLALAGTTLVAILLHLPTLNNDFVFDDWGVIGHNPLMHDVSLWPRLLVTSYWNDPAHQRMLYRPLASLSFAMDRAIAGGMKARWFHLVNVILHGCVTFLVTFLAFEILPGVGPPVVAGLLFAAHPVHVEAVAGIVGRSEILAAGGGLLAIVCHLRALRIPDRRAFVWMGGSWIAYGVALMGKESAVVTPALCLLTEFARPALPDPLRRGRRLALYAGHAAVLATSLAMRVSVLGTLGIGGPIPYVDNPAASAGPLAGRLTALGTVARYAVLLVWPARLSVDYSYDQVPVIRTLADPWALVGLLLLLLTVGGGVWLLRRDPVCSWGLLWIAVSASPTSNLVFFIGTLLAERLMYLPSVGLCLLFGWALGVATRRGLGKVGLAAATALLSLAAARVWSRLPDWKDDFALYRSAVSVSPRSARIRYNLGNAYLEAGDYGAAEAHYRAALAIYADFDDARVNLGMALLHQARPEEALPLLKTAAELDPDNADVAVDLGAAYRALGQAPRAEEEFRRALALDPRSARAWNNLGSLYLARGELPRAIEHLEKAIRFDPDLAILRINLGDALTAASRAGEAAEQFVAAARLDPDLPESHRGLGEVAMRRGDLAAAEREFRLAAEARRPSARAANFLGYLLALRGDDRQAAEQYEKALRIDPGLHDAHRSLGLLFAQRLGDPARAVEHLEASLRLDPGQPGAEDLRRLLRSLKRER